jgi:hypothetical protein
MTDSVTCRTTFLTSSNDLSAWRGVHILILGPAFFSELILDFRFSSQNPLLNFSKPQRRKKLKQNLLDIDEQFNLKFLLYIFRSLVLISMYNIVVALPLSISRILVFFSNSYFFGQFNPCTAFRIAFQYFAFDI